MDVLNAARGRSVGVAPQQHGEFLNAFVAPAVEQPSQVPEWALGSAPWYAARNVSDTEAEILIYNYIGIGGVSADDFVREISAIKARNISLRVNSPGGFVDDGIAIFNAIRRHPASITAYVDGGAYSAASFLIQAADSVLMSPHTQMMIHDAQGFAFGSPEEMKAAYDMLERDSNSIAAIYAERTDTDPGIWRSAMRATTWYTAREAVEAGLADGIDGEEEDAPANRSRAHHSIDWLSTVRTAVAEGTRQPVSPAAEIDLLGAFRAAFAPERRA